MATFKEYNNQKDIKYPVTIKQSNKTNGGRGVFATRNIKKGEVVCYYDGKDIDLQDITTKDQPYAMNDPDDKNKTRIGHIEPRCSYGIGQLINDSTRMVFNTTNEIKLTTKLVTKLYNSIKIYEKKARWRANVAFAGEPECKWWMYAAKNIKKGKELYLYYGAHYWIAGAINNTDKISWRKLLFMFIDKRYVIKSKANIDGVNQKATNK